MENLSFASGYKLDSDLMDIDENLSVIEKLPSELLSLIINHLDEQSVTAMILVNKRIRASIIHLTQESLYLPIENFITYFYEQSPQDLPKALNDVFFDFRKMFVVSIDFEDDFSLLKKFSVKVLKSNLEKIKGMFINEIRQMESDELTKLREIIDLQRIPKGWEDVFELATTERTIIKLGALPHGSNEKEGAILETAQTWVISGNNENSNQLINRTVDEDLQEPYRISILKDLVEGEYIEEAACFIETLVPSTNEWLNEVCSCLCVKLIKRNQIERSCRLFELLSLDYIRQSALIAMITELSSLRQLKLAYQLLINQKIGGIVEKKQECFVKLIKEFAADHKLVESLAILDTHIITNKFRNQAYVELVIVFCDQRNIDLSVDYLNKIEDEFSFISAFTSFLKMLLLCNRIDLAEYYVGKLKFGYFRDLCYLNIVKRLISSEVNREIAAAYIAMIDDAGIKRIAYVETAGVLLV